MRYLITIGEETLEVDVERSVDGNYRVVASDGTELDVQPVGSRAGALSVLVQGEVIEVRPEAGEALFRQQRFETKAETRLERALRPSTSNLESRGQRLVSSMPGRVVRVVCEVGENVVKGASLIVIEAMKMQNELSATTSGVVRRVHVSVGQNVERGALLVEIE